MKSKTLKPLISAYYVATIFVHVLVITKVVPYNWVNGGLSENYEAQVTQSIVSIAILSAMFLFALNILRTISITQTWKRRLFYALSAFTVLSLVMQLMGTNFERFVLAPIVFVWLLLHLQVVAHLNRARKARGK